MIDAPLRALATAVPIPASPVAAEQNIGFSNYGKRFCVLEGGHLVEQIVFK